MNLLEGLIYGLVSGITEFLPISSHAHQRLLMLLFGVESRDPVRDLFIHVMLLISVFSGCRSITEQLRQSRNRQVHSNRFGQSSGSHAERRLVKNAAAPLVIGFLILNFVFKINESLLLIALFLLLNGIILFIPTRMMKANKDARSMSVFDSILIGIAGAFSAFTGISRMGFMTSVAVSRGADSEKALSWAFLLSIPALALLAGIDVIRIISTAGSVNFFANFFSYVFSAAGAYCGGYFGIMLIKSWSARTDLAGFSYYSWGTALFSFLLYLIVV